VEPSRHASHPVREPRLDIHVDVFQSGIEVKFPRLDLRRQRLETADQGFDVRLGDESHAP
jgi:hypothetical protein